MAERLSTGYVNAKNTVGSTKSIMDGGVIHVFADAIQPASADLAETGTLVLVLTKDGLAHTPGSATNGIVLGTSTDGVLGKNADVVKGVGLAAAGASPGKTALWFRWYDVDVVTGDSTTAIRIDGAVGTSTSYEMLMSNPRVVEAVESIVGSVSYQSKKA